MHFIQGNDRYQTYFATLNDQVSADNPVRLMDAFIDKLDLQKSGFKNTMYREQGRPPYAPGVFLKLYLCGYLNKIRGSKFLNPFIIRILDPGVTRILHLPNHIF